MSDEEDYDFQYSDAEEEEEAGDASDLTVQAQNLYYTSKSQKDGDLPAARAGMLQVVALAATAPEASSSNVKAADWAFKALKQLTKMAISVGDFGAALEHYK